MNLPQTYLAPGQRYIQPGGDWRRDQQITIARLDRDVFGLPRVVFACPDGREVTAYAAQVEAAVAGGELTPIAFAGRPGRCG